jgi:hypothetical protein
VTKKDDDAIANAFADTVLWGSGFTRMTTEGITHIPRSDIMKIMKHKYTPLPTSCDLSVTSFEWAMGSTNTPIYLHVHPSLVERAKEIITAPHAPGRRIDPEVVADETLNVNEWYLVSSIGSDPP